MAELLFPYHTQYKRDQISNRLYTTYVPYVPIKMAYRHKLDKIPTTCLVDSGASINLFPSDWGKALGMRISKGTPYNILGIGGIVITAYGHPVTIYVSQHRYEVEVYFHEQQTIPLLGIDGFFNCFKQVTFNNSQKQLELLL